MRCFYCMEEYDENLDVICPYCGNDIVAPDSDSYCLSAGTLLNQRYVLGRVLGDGGFGITYIGYDKALKRKVAIKEFFPNECVTRQKNETAVSPFSGERGERYQKGLENFTSEAQRLAKLGSIEGVVNVYDVFSENGTAYIVMEYLSGETVAQMVEGHKFLGFGKTMNIIVSVLKSLKNVHAAGVIHRDISPKNIIKTTEGKIVLIDFGAAKQTTLNMSKSASIVLTQGYAPIEQYNPKLSQGTWTDVYAVAATMYYMLTGVTPDYANSRLLSDTMVPVSELHPGVPEKLDDIIKNALAIMPEDRTQTAEELLEQIWTLRSAQNTTRRSKQKTPTDKANTVSPPPAPRFKQKSPEPSSKKQWKQLASDTAAPKRIISEHMTEEPEVITISKHKETVKPLVPEKLPAKKPSGALIAAAVVLVAILGVLVGIGFHDRANNSEIPDFIGQNIDSVLNSDEYEFDFETVYSYDPDTDLDVIVNQSPLASSRHVRKDTHVRLTVNSLETEVNIPVLTKSSETVAVNVLKQLYLDSKVVIVNNDEFADGTVVSSEPSNGTKVKVGTVVTLYVAQNSVSVPKLLGKTLQQATEELAALGLGAGETTYDYSDEYETGCVIAQGIEPNTKVVKDTAVSMVISSGKPVPVTLEANVSFDGLNTPFSVKAVCDGVTEYERKRYSLVFEDGETIAITRNINEGSKTVEIYIDDDLYQTYTFDFENAVVTLNEQYEVSAAKRKQSESSSSASSSSVSSRESVTPIAPSESTINVSSEFPEENKPEPEVSSVAEAESSSASVGWSLPFLSDSDR